MTLSPSEPTAASASVETAIALANGSIMRELGLDRETLRLGLVIASQHMQRGAYDEAFQTYGTLMLCNPSDPDFHIGLSDCALHLGVLDIALKTASAAIGMLPQDPRGYLLSARALMQLKQSDAAAADAREAIRLASAGPTSDLNDHIVTSAERILAMLVDGGPE